MDTGSSTQADNGGSLRRSSCRTTRYLRFPAAAGRSYRSEPGTGDAELFDPVLNTWRLTGSLVNTQFGTTLAAPVADGRILAVGYRSFAYHAEIYDSDGDGDGYNSWEELRITENGALYCDLMRADLNSDGVVNSIDQGRYASQYLRRAEAGDVQTRTATG